MNPLAAPARMSADDLKHTAALTHHSFLTKMMDSLASIIIRRKKDDIAKRYEGCSWCDSTEHDLNYDVMTGRNTGPQP